MIDLDRYDRQIRLPEIGLEGQQRLADSSVLVIGAGGLGSPVLHLLAAAGVGTLGISEFDQVDVSNLHRQTLYDSRDIGDDKMDAAVRRIEAVNPSTTVVPFPGRFEEPDADSRLQPFDLVVDGSDTFGTRYVVNDAAVRTQTAAVFASVTGFSGQATVYLPGESPCYRCVFPEPPAPGDVPTCDSGGVLGPVASLMGGLQAIEALKILLGGLGRPLAGRLLLVDALTMRMRELQTERDPACPACGRLRASAPAPPRPSVREIDASELALRLAGTSPPFVLDVREAAERQRQPGPGTRLIPLGQLAVRLFELDEARERELVVVCQSGARSAQAARLLAEHGFRVSSLRGGVEAWERRP